ncbi:MAG: hypothetical protein FJX76_06060 [Armatimonadetes bacterium]|nr:hypothetical protein [Armatimonadota bacterium]
MRRSIAVLAVVLLLSSAVGGQSMFDLPEGAYVTCDNQTPLLLRIGDAKTRVLHVERLGASVDGTYRVTATKMGDYHATLTVQTVKGKAVDVLGLNAAQGDQVRVNFNFGGMDDGAVMVTVFNADIKPVMSRTFYPRK